MSVSQNIYDPSLNQLYFEVLLFSVLDMIQCNIYSIFTSLLYIETADRAGLLGEIISVIADINIDVESAEIDTEVLLRPFFLVSLQLYSEIIKFTFHHSGFGC